MEDGNAMRQRAKKETKSRSRRHRAIKAINLISDDSDSSDSDGGYGRRRKGRYTEDGGRKRKAASTGRKAPRRTQQGQKSTKNIFSGGVGRSDDDSGGSGGGNDWEFSKPPAKKVRGRKANVRTHRRSKAKASSRRGEKRGWRGHESTGSDDEDAVMPPMAGTGVSQMSGRYKYGDRKKARR